MPPKRGGIKSTDFSTHVIYLNWKISTRVFEVTEPIFNPLATGSQLSTVNSPPFPSHSPQPSASVLVCNQEAFEIAGNLMCQGFAQQVFLHF